MQFNSYCRWWVDFILSPNWAVAACRVVVGLLVRLEIKLHCTHEATHVQPLNKAVSAKAKGVRWLWLLFNLSLDIFWRNHTYLSACQLLPLMCQNTPLIIISDILESKKCHNSAYMHNATLLLEILFIVVLSGGGGQGKEKSVTSRHCECFLDSAPGQNGIVTIFTASANISTHTWTMCVV